VTNTRAWDTRSSAGSSKRTRPRAKRPSRRPRTALPRSTPTPLQTAPPAPEAGTGKVDFDAVFDAAGIPAEQRGQVDRARDLLANLPAETPATVKKQIVAASLKAFGIPIEQILAASTQEIQALEGYIQAGAAQAESFRTEAERKVAAFEQEIKRIREAAESRIREQQAASSACGAKKQEVQQILDFFGAGTPGPA
jgi:hypothetical protein